jgi:hypothetical protein
MAKPAVGFLIEEESASAVGALHASTAKTLSTGAANPYHVSVWGPTFPKNRLLLDQTPNPFFRG